MTYIPKSMRHGVHCKDVQKKSRAPSLVVIATIPLSYFPCTLAKLARRMKLSKTAVIHRITKMRKRLGVKIYVVGKHPNYRYEVAK